MELEHVKNRKSSATEARVLTREDVTRDGASSSVLGAPTEGYRLYKRRWAGLAGLCLLNIVAGLNWLWFSSIAIKTSNEFGASLQRVNWLGNSVNLVYLPISLLVPLGCARWGLRISCAIGSLCLLISAWIRYASTAKSLSSEGKYALLLLGQIFTGFGQPWFQILGPKYSEVWFDLRGRTTATMIIAIANPIGGALSQLIAPAFSSVRDSILVLAIITTVAVPTVFFIYPLPPTPPTFAGSLSSPPAAQVFRAWIGRSRPGEAFMSKQERIDLFIVTILFGVLVGPFDAFSILINQVFAPYGYSSDASGIFGGVLILAGIVGAAVMSPIFDRYLTHHLGLASKVLVPVLAGSYIGLIWDVRANNDAGIYVLMVVIGVASFTLLPVALEIGCEVTRSAETSSSVLWFAGNLLSVVFVLSMDALRDDSPTANPPSNMRKSLIFQACFVSVVALSVVGLKAEQNRRKRDLQDLESTRNEVS
ncbi:major facilitator superfamily transporter [Ceratobasidium sp. AG-Ba]|nr:major facilitator superfamily transporter [Ceratobasidium sp. AG-Ba]QRW08015.1 major facilitator superfamily transporter [Ceratobasidium sp. AG-Ba]